MPVESELSRFSLLSFSQNFLAGVADRSCISLCFLAIRFHAWVVILTSIKSHFWSSLGHRGHCCVFVVVFGLFGTQSVSRLPFCSAVPSLLRNVHMLEQRRSDRDCHRAAMCCAATLTATPSPATAASLVRRTAATTLAASQMHLLSL